MASLIRETETLLNKIDRLEMKEKPVMFANFIIDNDYDSKLSNYIKSNRLYCLVSSGPIKQYRSVIGYLQTDTDCIDFELSDRSIMESFVENNRLEGIYVKNYRITNLTSGGGKKTSVNRKTRRKLNR